jgi:hypothetical protein
MAKLGRTHKNGNGNGAHDELRQQNGNSSGNASNDSSGVPTPDLIARRAFEIYESEGRQDGRELENWLRAEAELRSPNSSL